MGALGTVVPNGLEDKSEKTETSYFRKNNSMDTKQRTRFKLGSSSWAWALTSEISATNTSCGYCTMMIITKMMIMVVNNSDDNYVDYSLYVTCTCKIFSFVTEVWSRELLSIQMLLIPVLNDKFADTSSVLHVYNVVLIDILIMHGLSIVMISLYITYESVVFRCCLCYDYTVIMIKAD